MTCLDRWQHLPRICLALVPLFACLFPPEVQGLVLAQGGKTDYHLYVGVSAAPADRYAGRELAAFLEQAAGGYWLPPEGNWPTLLSVRIDPGTGAATDLALRMGVYPGVQREVHVTEAVTAYKLFELPGTWRQDKARAIWVAPPGSGAIEALYVDRVIAVRQ